VRENMVAAGEWRGGVGSVRAFTYLSDGGFSVEGDGQKHRPWGFDGGSDGYPGELIMATKDGTRIALPSKVPYRKAAPGDCLIAYGPSGGGYGDPFLRDPAAVLDNVLDGLLSSEVAREHYGVVISGSAVDVTATERMRKAQRAT
jgi:N-methylhydantoinase B